MTNLEPIRLDGSFGEGGGQILRTALALSAVTGRPLELSNIRKGRKNPGLGNQHLTCVKALTDVAHAQVEGDRLGSLTLRFTPKALHGGASMYDVAKERGSAGSVTLVLQALLPTLCVAPEPSTVILKGGTHVPFSPPVHYVQAVLLPTLNQLGLGHAGIVFHALQRNAGCHFRGIMPPSAVARDTPSAIHPRPS